MSAAEAVPQSKCICFFSPLKQINMALNDYPRCLDLLHHAAVIPDTLLPGHSYLFHSVSLPWLLLFAFFQTHTQNAHWSSSALLRRCFLLQTNPHFPSLTATHTHRSASARCLPVPPSLVHKHTLPGWVLPEQHLLIRSFSPDAAVSGEGLVFLCTSVC